MNRTESERLRRATERLVDGQREALEVLRRTLDGEAPAEDALVDLEDILEGALEDARSILGMEEGTKRDRPRPESLFASVLTVRIEEDESFGETGDNTRGQTGVPGRVEGAATGASARAVSSAPSSFAPRLRAAATRFAAIIYP